MKFSITFAVALTIICMDTIHASQHPQDDVQVVFTAPASTKDDEHNIVPSSRRSRRYKYYISPFQATFLEAADYCARTHSQLLSIRNDAEEAEVEGLLSQYQEIITSDLWLWGYCENGVWTWGDYRPVSNLFSNLFEDKRECETGENNLMMYGPNEEIPLRFKWIGANRSEKKFFICKSYSNVYIG